MKKWLTFYRKNGKPIRPFTSAWWVHLITRGVPVFIIIYLVMVISCCLAGV